MSTTLPNRNTMAQKAEFKHYQIILIQKSPPAIDRTTDGT